MCCGVLRAQLHELGVDDLSSSLIIQRSLKKPNFLPWGHEGIFRLFEGIKGVVKCCFPGTVTVSCCGLKMPPLNIPCQICVAWEDKIWTRK